MGCNCNNGLRFAFKELNADTKPFLQLSNCEEARILADALTIARCACGKLQGCRTSSICTSVEDFTRWQADASNLPCYDVGRVLALLSCPSNECPPNTPNCEICFDGNDLFAAAH
jgi:hypothetical protein